MRLWSLICRVCAAGNPQVNRMYVDYANPTGETIPKGQRYEMEDGHVFVVEDVEEVAP